MEVQPSPERILQTGLAFWASKALLSAVEMGLFTELSRGPEDFDSLRGRMGLHPRSARDFLDALVALGFLVRDGNRYGNTPETGLFLDRRSRSPTRTFAARVSTCRRWRRSSRSTPRARAWRTGSRSCPAASSSRTSLGPTSC